MGVGVEDVIAVKILEHGIVPPVPNFKEVDPDLGVLNLSRGGRYPVQYALHLAAGFGSQISLTLTRRIPGGLDRVDHKGRYTRWLADVSGLDDAETEVVKRVLRVKANGAPGRAPIASAWRYGVGPTSVQSPLATGWQRSEVRGQRSEVRWSEVAAEMRPDLAELRKANCELRNRPPTSDLNPKSEIPNP